MDVKHWLSLPFDDSGSDSTVLASISFPPSDRGIPLDLERGVDGRATPGAGSIESNHGHEFDADLRSPTGNWRSWQASATCS
jgi:hypothetical protein